MIHAKFRINLSTGSREEDFCRVSSIYGHSGHLGQVTWNFYIYIGSHFLQMLHIKFGGFCEEDL